MSAFMVQKTHIDALITAGLEWGQPGKFGRVTWFWPPVWKGDTEGAWQEGSPWGPDAGRVIEERRRELNEDTASSVGQMLVAENARSLAFRYGEHQLDHEVPYTFTKLKVQGPPPVGMVLGAISCYEYQACEHPEWQLSEAYAFCDALRHLACNRVSSDAEGVWDITDPLIFAPGARARAAREVHR